MKSVWMGLAALILGVTACAMQKSRIPEPTEKMAMELGVEFTEIQRGYASYLASCSKCHERVPPPKVDPEYWRGILPHMAENAKLTEKEEDELLLYLLAAHGTVHRANLQH